MNIEKKIKCRLRRHRSGIEVWVRVAPEVEDFFKKWGGGIEEPVAYGRMWKPMPNQEPLRFWSLEERLSEANNYNLYRTGTHLVDDANGFGINISFLRLVGASNKEGVSFIVEVPISADEITKISSRIHKAGEQFISSYIQPVDVLCYVGTIDYSRAGLGEGSSGI